MMAEVAAAVEAAVRQAPDQWFNFYRYWEHPGGPPP
jgi:predicted LPLAT superfamily acyltransferase